MKKFLNNLWLNIRKTSLKFKVLIAFVIALYIFIIGITTISINVFSDNDYYMLTPGEISKVDNVIKVDTIHNSGEIYTISVYEFREISILQYWLAKNSKNYLIGEDSESYLSNQELFVQGTIMKDNSITNSIIVAYNEAKKINPAISIDYEFVGIIVHSISKEAKGDIKLSDIIIEVNGSTFSNQNEFITLLNSAKVNMNLSLKVIRDNKEIDVQTSFYSLDGELYIGINGYEHYVINSTNPSYETFNNNTTGPSGGFMQTLAIYNALLAKDITNGKKLVGTGTISVNGIVGAIGGVEQKIITANTYKADYMFVPSANYQEAVAQYESINNPSFPKPIAISNFTEVITFLEGLVS